MSEEILIRQGAPTLAGIKTGSLFPCPCDDREALLTDVRRLNRQLVPKGLCLLPIRFKDGQALLYLYRPAVLHRDLQDGLFLSYPPEDVQGFIDHRACDFKCAGLWKVYSDEERAQRLFTRFKRCTEDYCARWQAGSDIGQLAVAM